MLIFGFHHWKEFKAENKRAEMKARSLNQRDILNRMRRLAYRRRGRGAWVRGKFLNLVLAFHKPLGTCRTFHHPRVETTSRALASASHRYSVDFRLAAHWAQWGEAGAHSLPHY